jgi:hypothetical protein
MTPESFARWEYPDISQEPKEWTIKPASIATPGSVAGRSEGTRLHENLTTERAGLEP